MATPTLLYPCDPFDRNKADEAYEEEYSAAQDAGFACLLFSAEDFAAGEFKPRPANLADRVLIYRGWMMPPERFAALQMAIEAKGAATVVSAEDYRQCHYLPGWYAQCQDLTPKTIFLSVDDALPPALARTGWRTYFVKDYVKSLTTKRGSVARNEAEVREVIELIERYRGFVEGGICIREFEDLQPDTEERYFVVRGNAFGCDGVVPPIVYDIAGRIESPFFSVDIVLNAEGMPRLIELGDGQVSDRKKCQGFCRVF